VRRAGSAWREHLRKVRSRISIACVHWKALAMFIRLVIGWVLASSLLAQTQGQVWRRSALARQGLHHSSISGRFVDGEGKPVSGIHVQIVEWLNPPGEYPTARTSSAPTAASDLATSARRISAQSPSRRLQRSLRRRPLFEDVRVRDPEVRRLGHAGVY